MSTCPMCMSSLHKSCLTKSCECNQRGHVIEPILSHTSEALDQPQDKLTAESPEEETRGSILGHANTTNLTGTTVKRVYRQKRDATLKDQQSTGRKRAARMYPLDREASCEWKDLADCGGGTAPIIGCVSGLQESRHHGPDKSTSNNDSGNVHRICHRCHNRWHAANNKDYDWNSTLVNPHSPRAQTEKERQQAIYDELTFKATKQKKVKD